MNYRQTLIYLGARLYKLFNGTIRAIKSRLHRCLKYIIRNLQPVRQGRTFERESRSPLKKWQADPYKKALKRLVLKSLELSE